MITTPSCGTATATSVITVNTTPVAGSITGASPVCTGTSITLSDATAVGGARVWSSSNTAAGTVDAVSGILHGVSAGTTTISYTVSTASCGTVTATTIVTVNTSPAAGFITGAGSVCSGTSITLSDATAVDPGVWSSSNTAAGTVDPVSGVVHGVSAGTTIISYTIATASCGSAMATSDVTVNATPVAGAITGPGSVCTGTTITLTDAAATGGAGAWSSSNIAAGTIDPLSGILDGITAGTTVITYTVSTASCGTVTATSVVTVNTTPVAGTITGPSSVCVGAAITLTDVIAGSGGTWSSSNMAAGTVSAAGVVSGLSAGATNITYTTADICGTAGASYIVTVNPLPDAGTISGLSSVCVNSTISLTDAVSGGTWSSSNVAVAAVGSTGIVTGALAGNASIVYTNSNGCGTATAGYSVTVNPLPDAGAINGLMAVCLGGNISLSDSVLGGVWSSGNTSVATIGSAGLVSGLSAGTTSIFYSYTNVCGTAVDTISMSVDSAFVATVNVYATPGNAIYFAQADTFMAVVTGVSASDINYQWFINSDMIPGATNSTFTSSVLANHDSVSCFVTGKLPCIYPSFNSVIVAVNVEGVPQCASGGDNVRLIPNPNNGQFTIKGALGISDPNAFIEITDMLGQVVYKSNVAVKDGAISEQIQLSNTMANGMYILNLHSGTKNDVFHFVIEQ